jgi:hypothetical protein
MAQGPPPKFKLFQLPSNKVYNGKLAKFIAQKFQSEIIPRNLLWGLKETV